MTNGIEIGIGSDGYYHPSTEGELISLVRWAYERSVQLRVRGSQHTNPTAAIYTDGFSGTGEPPPGFVDVMLDRYRAVTITPDPATGEADVVVEAGCNLGKNPYDPTRTSTWENSLNLELQKAGYALADLGGITHQTISGFLSTGSTGGSLTYSFFDENLVGLDIIDGTGTLHRLRKNDPATGDMFNAAGVSMGLLGVISKVYLRVKPTFDIYGTQTTSDVANAGIDLFGTGDGSLPTLEQFFRRTPYTRLMWWPQRGVQRISVWQAARLAPEPGFVPQPYLEMGRAPVIASLAGSLFYTIIGNLLDIRSIPGKLDDWYTHLKDWLIDAPDPNACCVDVAVNGRVKPTLDAVLADLRGRLQSAFAEVAAAGGRPAEIMRERAPKLHGAVLSQSSGVAAVPSDPVDLPPWLADIIVAIVRGVIEKVMSTEIMLLVAWLLSDLLPWLIGPVLRAFVTNGTQYFWESWRCGLPMDNQMDDQLWDTLFTELWIPIDKWSGVMKALQSFYAGDGSAPSAYAATGAFSCEIYAASKSDFWMSPSYGTDVIRIDIFWFGLNQVGPDVQFYPAFWDLLKEFEYRPHWGKWLGPPANYLPNLPRLKDFLALRERLDPKGIFLTDYWKRALGLSPYVPPNRTVNLLAACPTGPGAIATGTKIKLGMITLDGTDLVIGDGRMIELTEGSMVAKGTYDFEYRGKSYSGTWATSMVRTQNGYTFDLAEEFTGTIAMKDAFQSDALQMGSGEGTTIGFTQITNIIMDLPVIDIQTFQNESPGKKAMIKLAGPVPVFLYANAYYVNAAYYEENEAAS